MHAAAIDIQYEEPLKQLSCSCCHTTADLGYWLTLLHFHSQVRLIQDTCVCGLSHLEVVQPLGVDSEHLILLVQGKEVHIADALLFLLLHILGLWLDPRRESINLQESIITTTRLRTIYAAINK